MSMLIAIVLTGLGPFQASPDDNLRIETEEVAHPLDKAFKMIEDETQNLLLSDPSLKQASFADVNGDGEVDAADLIDWKVDVVAALTLEDGTILEYGYVPDKDINMDGILDHLDFAILKLRVARVLAAEGEQLVWGKQTVSPFAEIRFFGGGHVILTSPSETPPTEPVAEPVFANPGEISPLGQFSPDHTDSKGMLAIMEPCRPEILFNSSWPPTPDDMTDEWVTQLFVCGTPYNYDGLVRIAESYYGNDDFHLNCGVTGPLGFSVTAAQTIKSSVSVSAGLKIDQVFNFGVQWGQSATKTRYHQILWMRIFQAAFFLSPSLN